MIAPAFWVIVVPILVVNGDPHLRRIAVIEAFGAAIVLVTPVVLRVVNIGVVVESFPIMRTVGVAPSTAIGALLRLHVFRLEKQY